MAYIDSDTQQALFMGAAAALGVNFLSERYFERDPQVRNFTLVDLNWTGLSNLDLVYAAAPWVVRAFAPDMVSQAAALGWTSSIVLVPNATSRLATIAAKLGL